MNTQNQNDYLNGLSKITHDIAKKSASGDYIYRGEPKYYEKISSTLYRRYPAEFDSGKFNLEGAQEEILKEARNYIHEPEKKDFEILTELQHYGSKTNLIDFTTDYYIALFFACDGFHEKDSRIVLLQKNKEITKKYQIEKPQHLQKRIMAQKSIFVRPPKGFIDPNDVITIPIPANLKQWILIHLRNFQDISTQTIYNDLHGFIRHSNLRSLSEARFPFVWVKGTEQNPPKSKTAEEEQNELQDMIKAYTTQIQHSPYDDTLYVDQGMCYLRIQEFDRAIETFSKAILLRPVRTTAYFWRGEAYFVIGNYDRAISDYDKVIEWNPDFAGTYNNRGEAYYHKGDYDRAIVDYTKAIELNPDPAATYVLRGQAYLKKDDKERAEADFAKARQLGYTQ